MDYIKYHERLIEELNYDMNQSKSKVFLFGAHIFSQYLIEFGLNINKINCILDNDSQKQGKRLYGSKLYVKSPKVLKEIDEPIIILKAGTYNDEIKEDILKNINPKAKFI